MSDQIWIHSKWKSEELQAESVEFKLPISDGEVHGIGQFVVAQNPEGLLSIDIRTNLRASATEAAGTYNFHLGQWAADHIERHPVPKTADFRCFG